MKKMQYDIYREVAKISALSSGKTDKYEYFTGKKNIVTSRENSKLKLYKF